MPSAEIQDIELTTLNEAIADGYFNSGNSEMILKNIQWSFKLNRVCISQFKFASSRVPRFR